MAERWRPVAGYEGLYEVSEQGSVRSLPRQAGKYHIKGRLLKQFQNRAGYLCVCLSKEGEQTTVAVHRLVASAFVPNPEGKETVNHINEDKGDNRACNLEWLTLRENLRHGTRAERQREAVTESVGVSVIQIASDGHTALKAHRSLSLAAEAVGARVADIHDSTITGHRCRGFFWRRLDSITERDLIFWAGTGERVSGPEKDEYPRLGF